jgi:hypothetical protein
MWLLSDEHYLHWPQFAQRIAFTHNTATHDGIGPITSFEVHHEAPVRNTLASALADRPPLSESEELALPAQFAAAVAVSTSAFVQLAKTHDSFVKTETAAHSVKFEGKYNHFFHRRQSKGASAANQRRRK